MDLESEEIVSMEGNRNVMLNHFPGAITAKTRQIHHVFALWVLYRLLYFSFNAIGGDLQWAWMALLVAVFHQGIVVLVWRAELFGGGISRRLGSAGFPLFGIVFFLLFFTRIGSCMWAAAESPYTLPLPRFVSLILFIPALLLCIWTIYSVFRYFGIKRALGADHFFPEYRQRDWVRQGVFRYNSNGMYTFGTFIFVLPGLWFHSSAGVAVGIFHYLAVWVHYWATELPDLHFIYGKVPN